jgi:hypothetical protein
MVTKVFNPRYLAVIRIKGANGVQIRAPGCVSILVYNRNNDLDDRMERSIVRPNILFLVCSLLLCLNSPDFLPYFLYSARP